MRLSVYPAVGAFLAGGYAGLGLYRLSGLWRPHSPQAAQGAARWWGRRLWPLLRLRVRTYGAASSATGICIANHRSYLDVLVLAGTVGGAFLSRDDLREWPLVGAVATEVGSVFVARDDLQDRMRAARALLRAARHGRVLVFPEGTTTGEPLPSAFEPGLFRLLHRHGEPVVPITLRYSDRRAYWVEELSVWQHLRDRVFNGPRLTVDVHVGKAIRPSDCADAEALQTAIYDAIAAPLRSQGELCAG